MIEKTEHILGFFVNINKNTFDIIEALQVRLNHEDEEAQETTKFLYRFYNIVFAKTAMILDEGVDSIQQYEDLINYIKPVYERWDRMAYPEKYADSEESGADEADSAVDESEDNIEAPQE